MMKKITPTNLKEATALISKLSLKDIEKLREIIDTEIGSRRDEKETEISPERAIEVLWAFHDDFYMEEKDGFSRRELRSALRWILALYGKHFTKIELEILANNTDSNRVKHRADRLRRQAFLRSYGE